jgi:hypothetical protein
MYQIRVSSLRSAVATFWVIIAIFALTSHPARAASVLQLGVADLVRGSQLIFHGTAVDRRTVAGSHHGDIFTRVTFRVDEVIKGPTVRTLDLDFLGGTLNGVTLEISDMTVPPVGEEGIFFIEQVDRPQVNPIYGWWQGYFVVRHGQGGRKIVTTHDLKPIYDLQPSSAIYAGGISEGAAEGVVTDGAATGRSPLSLADFESSLRRLLEILR